AGVQVGSETHQCVCEEVETRDGHIPSSMRGVYHHYGGHVRFRIIFTEVGSIWAGYERHSRCHGMIRLKYKEYDTLKRTSFRLSEVI
ncbi:hypothetical protein J1N35_045847, partial [Gossypium stocksii]